jgi:hypothetical protein
LPTPACLRGLLRVHVYFAYRVGSEQYA